MGAGVEAAYLAALTEWSIMVPMATPRMRVPRIIEKKRSLRLLMALNILSTEAIMFTP